MFLTRMESDLERWSNVMPNNTRNLTQQDIADWALDHGFSWVQGAGPEPGAVLAVPYKGGEIRIVFLKRDIQVLACHDGQEQRIGRGRPGSHYLFIGHYGVLEGVGLSNSFLMRCREAADIPPWYPEEARAEIAAALFPDPQPNHQAGWIVPNGP